MFYGISLTAILVALWLTLSGPFTLSGDYPIVMGLGVLSIIVKANLAVLRLVMKPEIEVEPRLIRVPAEQRTDLGRSVFANSITLTPGTVTVDVEDDGFLVHALDNSFTDPAGFAEMGARSDIASDGKKKRAD